MNLTKCPHCNNDLPSDSLFCNKCGNKIENSSVILNEDANDKVQVTTEEINNIEDTKIEVQDVEIIETPIKKKSKLKIIIPVVVALVLIISAMSTYLIIRNHKNNIASEKAYTKNFEMAVTRIQLSALTTEMRCSSIISTWQDAIDNGDDFNDKLSEYIDSQSKSIKSDKKSDEEIGRYMDKIQSPIDKYKSSYDALVNVYGTYEKILQKSMNPSGSLLTYANEYHKLTAEFNENVSKLQAVMPNSKNMRKLNKSLESLKNLLGTD